MTCTGRAIDSGLGTTGHVELAKTDEIKAIIPYLGKAKQQLVRSSFATIHPCTVFSIPR